MTEKKLAPYITDDGWLRVAYDGYDLSFIEMEATGTGWCDAYLDWDEQGQRVAQIRWDGPLPDVVNLRVDGQITGWYKGGYP